MDYALSDIFALICENDGGTFFPTDFDSGRFAPSEALNGYFVAQSGAEYVVSVDDFSAADIAAYVRTHRSRLISGAYFGAWISDGQVFLDISEWYGDLAVAISVGHRNSQLAIWDIAASSEITL